MRHWKDFFLKIEHKCASGGRITANLHILKWMLNHMSTSTPERILYVFLYKSSKHHCFALTIWFNLLWENKKKKIKKINLAQMQVPEIHKFLKLVNMACALPNVTSRVLVVGLRLRMAEQHIFQCGVFFMSQDHREDVETDGASFAPACLLPQISAQRGLQPKLAASSYTLLVMSSPLAYLGWPLRGGVCRHTSHHQCVAGLMH